MSRRSRHGRTAELWGECRRKQRYPSIDDAEAHRITRERESGVPLMFYACKHCGGYHLTKDLRRPDDERERSTEEP